MATYIYKRTSVGTTRTTYRWDSASNVATVEVTLGVVSTPVSYPNNTIVDVYQSGANVKIVTFNSSNYGGATVDGSYPRLFLNSINVVGNTGDIQNTLLYKRCNTEASPPTFEFAVYSNITKDVSVFFYPLALAPFCSAYSVSEDTVIQQTCVVTTLRRTYYDGESGVTVEDTLNSVTCGYVAPVPDVVISEVKRIKIDHNCYNNPVFLVWKNTLGGWDHWLFYNAQTESLKTESIGEFTQPAYFIEQSEGLSKSLGVNANNTMILGANRLNDNQYLAIKDLITSPKIYKVETDGAKQIVLMKAGTFSKDTKDRLHSIEFEITLPDTFTVRS